MASPLDAIVILCDAAQTDGLGKLHMLGAGWSLTTSPTAPAAVAVMLKVPWDRTNIKLPLKLQLLTEDFESVVLPGQTDPIQFETELEVGRPPGLKAGTPIDAAFALNIAPLPLKPGSYRWQLTAGDDDQHGAPFTVR